MQAKFYYQDKNAPKPNKPNHIGVTAILINDGKILFEKRSDCARWSLIGGGLNINETLQECFAREVFEETGLEVQAPENFAIYDASIAHCRVSGWQRLENNNGGIC